MSHPVNVLSLVGDVGGTNTRLALAEGERILEGTVRRYPNADHPGLASVIERYLADEGGVDCAGAAIAVAGPVRDGVGSLTNLDWTFDKDVLQRATKAETVAVLNDLQAQGHALDLVADDRKTVIAQGPPAGPHAAKLVVNVGTGFNAAVVLEAEQGRLVPPSECGHANLPIRSEMELRLCEELTDVHGFPAIEEVLSGRGLERIYAWLGRQAGDPREKRAADIAAGFDGSDPRAEETARFFAGMFGRVSGNLCLIHLPFGGVYLVGGVARSMGPHLRRFGFIESLRDKGRFSGFMKNFGVILVEDDYAALTGLASHLTRIMPAR